MYVERRLNGFNRLEGISKTEPTYRKEHELAETTW